MTLFRPLFLSILSGNLKKRGHHIFVFTQDRQGEKEEFLEGVRIKWFPWIGSKRPLVQLNPFSPFGFVSNCESIL